MFIFSFLISKRAKFILLALLSRNYFYLSDQTGSGFQKQKVVCPKVHQTRTFGVLILKTRPLVAELCGHNIMTYRQTDRHTYTQTDRQTEPNYDIDHPRYTILFCSRGPARKPFTEPQFMSYAIWPMDCQNKISFFSLFPFFIPCFYFISFQKQLFISPFSKLK